MTIFFCLVIAVFVFFMLVFLFPLALAVDNNPLVEVAKRMNKHKAGETSLHVH